MAKPKSPLLSLEARGSIGDTLTYQQRGRQTIVREKPIPRDPYSLNQAYQRWDYRDYAYLWTLLSDSEKQIYRTKASKYHITGFSQWMREQLKDLPDMAGRWHLDYISNSLTPDSSKNTNHGTVFGASITDGIISKALSFDGLDDRVEIPSHPSLDISGVGSLEFSLKAISWKLGGIIQKGETVFATLVNYAVWSRANGKPIFYIGNGVGLNTVAVTSALDIDRWYRFFITWDSSKIRLYLDGVENNSANQTITPAPNTGKLLFGCLTTTEHFSNVIIDEAVIRTRVPDITEIKRHSERRYP